MANKKLKLKIVTPEKLVLEEMVDQVTLPSSEGEITVLPGHIPLIVGLSSGDIVAVNESEPAPYAVVGGFVEVKTDENNTTNVAILADFAEHVSAISDDQIEKAKTRAEELRKQMPARQSPDGSSPMAGGENKEVVDFEHFETELERSLTRVKIADKWRTKKYRK